VNQKPNLGILEGRELNTTTMFIWRIFFTNYSVKHESADVRETCWYSGEPLAYLFADFRSSRTSLWRDGGRGRDRPLGPAAWPSVAAAACRMAKFGFRHMALHAKVTYAYPKTPYRLDGEYLARPAVLISTPKPQYLGILRNDD
jgi:hypothetical protein